MAAHEAPLKTRQEEIDRIWQDRRVLWFVPGLVIGLLVGTFLQPSPHGWFAAFLQSFFNGIWPEIIGIVVTITIIQEMLNRREEKRRIKDLQDQLVRDAGSIINDVAVNAVHQLRRHGWLTGDNGLLVGANLYGANLEKARLTEAHLEGANLSGVNLEGAFLGFAHLEGANLRSTHLEGANLRSTHLEKARLTEAHLEGANLTLAYLEGAGLEWAHLERANLGNANLEEADLSYVNLKEAGLEWARLKRADLGVANLEASNLWGARLEGVNLARANLERANLGYANLEAANLVQANLEGANLGSVEFDENTILPDESQWTSDTDMNRFTDPQHPNFWRSDSPNSPAYRDKGNG